jgi:alpha-amylase/alpha-mannosidase (GH57 family)
MRQYVCIHGHFYQPPRENAWLESVELQDSAYPYHDWNERVTAECYAANAVSRILDSQNRITQITNNYARISFNFGPTLLAWMEPNAPKIYQAVIEADRESLGVFSGHGSAIAQAYNHMILPLASRRDKYTQVLWGIRDFEYRFGRKPEGMWLPETAVDIETLEIMAELGILFTILAPHQASQIRPQGKEKWQDVAGGKIDPTTCYTLNLPSGRPIALFFYDAPISQAVAFERLLNSGDAFYQRLLGAFYEKRTWPQLVHIATDGETYGHHHRYGDMALAYAIKHIQAAEQVQMTNYGEYLERHPPTFEVQIIENTSWSCAHGVERWRTDCGCNSGRHPEWNQAWRKPLREALDWLRDDVAPKYEEEARRFLKDPWAARNDYIDVLLDRSSEEVLDRFLAKHAIQYPDKDDKVRVLKLEELQRNAMLMYTSCGWFFDDLSGIETIQVIQYASRVVQLAQELFGDNTEESFLSLLEKADSNVPEYGDGRRVYEKFVKPAMVDLTRVAAHYAISSLFEEYATTEKIDCYSILLEDGQTSFAGITKLALGRARVTSQITRDSALLTFGVLHFGDHNINAGAREYQGAEAYQEMARELTEAFFMSDFPLVIRLMDKHFGISTYSLRSLFRDEQRKVVGRILESTLADFEAVLRQRYEYHYPLMRFLVDLGNPLPMAFKSAAEFISDVDLRKAFADTIDIERSKVLLDEAKRWNIEVDAEGLGYLLSQTLEQMMARSLADPNNPEMLQSLVAALEMVRSLPFTVDIWKVQNLYYQMLDTEYSGLKQKTKQGDERAAQWIAGFESLGELLSIKVG